MLQTTVAPQNQWPCTSKRVHNCSLQDDECNCTASHATTSTSMDDSQNSSSDVQLRGIIKKTSTPEHQRRKSVQTVSFLEVHIREYPVCVGDNPSVTAGVPISIQWEPFWEGCFSVDVYERFANRTAHNRKVPVLSPTQRYAMLQRGGESLANIAAAERDAIKDKLNRAMTNERGNRDVLKGALEGFTRGALNITLNRRKKKEQKKLLQQLRECDKRYLVASES